MFNYFILKIHLEKSWNPGSLMPLPTEKKNHDQMLPEVGAQLYLPVGEHQTIPREQLPSLLLLAPEKVPNSGKE